MLLFSSKFLKRALLALVVCFSIAHSAWATKDAGLLVLGVGIFDSSYKFIDDQKFQAFLKKINMKSGSFAMVGREVFARLTRDLSTDARRIGGSASNTAAGVGSFGADVTLHTIVADDELGRRYAKGMEQYGVKALTKTVRSTEGTAEVVVLVAPDGERTMLGYSGVSQQITPADIDSQTISKYKMVFSDGYLWNDDPLNNAAIRKFYRLARASGAVTAFTFGDQTLVTKYRSQWLPMIKDMDLIFADDEQIYALFGTQSWQEAVKRMKNYSTIFVVTFGKRGAYVVHGGQQIYIPVNKVAHVVDTTGAGDQFAAGFLYGYLNNMSLEDCGKLGAAAAARIIQQIGPKPKVSFAELLRTELVAN